MLRLVLLRHAKAVRSADYDDFDRPLEARGREGAALIGKFIAGEHIGPDVALVSSACRTRETWAIVRPYAGDAREVFDRRLYHAAPQDILEMIHGIGDDVRTAMVVGHNPGLALLADALAAGGNSPGGSSPLRQAMRHRFPTAALVVLDFAAGRWQDIAAGTGELAYFVYPKLLGLGD